MITKEAAIDFLESEKLRYNSNEATREAYNMAIEAIRAEAINKVYIVTSGKYSDRTIDAVFASPDKASVYAATHSHDMDEIQEFTLHDDQVEGVASKVVYVFGLSLIYNTDEYIRLESRNGRDIPRARYELDNYCSSWYEDNIDEYMTKPQRQLRHGYIVERSYIIINEPNAEKAEKIAQDRLAEFKYEMDTVLGSVLNVNC